MPRTIVDIPAAQMVEVDRLCQQLGISRAEAVRRALQAFTSGHAEVRSDGFGLWKPAATAAKAAPAAQPVQRAQPAKGRRR